MKKKILLALSLLAPMFSGCRNAKENLLNITFGKLYDFSLSTEVSHLYLHTTNITYDDLTRKIENKENFLLCVYEYKTLSKGGNIECTCYSSFAYSLNKYMQRHNAEIYAIDPNDFASNDRFSLSVVLGGQTLALFSKGKLIDQKNTSKDELSTLEKIEDYLSPKINWSKMLYVSKKQLDDMLETKGVYTIGFLRKTCSDCSYLNYNFLKKYNENSFNKNIYVIECDTEAIRYNASNEFDKEMWQNFKDEYGLSNKYNVQYGFIEGYVPSFLTYSISETKKEHYGQMVIDQAVYMNDTLEKDNGICKVANSYWNGSSHPFFEELAGDVITNLLSLEIEKDNYNEYEGLGLYWKKEAAAAYHDPLLKGFLDYYSK